MSGFDFRGMAIRRLIAHTVHQRDKDKQRINPTCSDTLIVLDQDSKDLIQMRVTGALGSTSHGVEMGIARHEAGSFMQRAASMISCDDPTFITESKELAEKLADAQTNPKWPGGVLIIISGTVGAQSKPFVAVIKAETDKGFNVVEKDGLIKLELVKKMLLSATQRLYKVGILIEVTTELPNQDGLYRLANYRAFLFDHLLTATETGAAAAYFYDAFLGMNILASSRKQTEVFFEESKNFFNAARITDEERANLKEALRSELKSNTATINATEFAEKNLPEALQRDYVVHLNSKGFPAQAVVKDTEYIKHKLRRPRNVWFTSGVIIRVPSDQNFAELVQMTPNDNGFTTVKIKGTVTNQD